MATTYDFRTLSPLDFEELVRDLLQAQWSLRLESFGAGADRGVDMRYLKGPHNVVIQAKHLAEGGYSALKRAVRNERDKALKLAPTRYILATSVPLTQDRKDELISLMEGVPLFARDILGREDLNNLLRQHGQIEVQHFKLWLSSASVLDRILHSGVYNRTEAEMAIIREMIPYFVRNASVPEAEAMLQETGALIIAGQPGVGKSTLARILLWLHAEQAWKIFVVDSLEEAFEVAATSEKRLILFDDFLGQVRLSADHVRGIDARLPPLLKRVSVHENLRFILTTRDYILTQARKLSDRLRPNEGSAREYVLNVGHYTRSVRARILYNHLYFSPLSTAQRDAVLKDDFFLAIIDHKNFNPRIIDEFTKPQYLALTDGSIRDTIMKILDNPQILWEIPFRDHIDPRGRHMMLALYLNGRDAMPAMLKNCYIRVCRALGSPIHASQIEESFRATFRSLDGSVMSLVGKKIMFTNPGVADYLASVIRSDRLVPLLLPEMRTYGEIRELWALWLLDDPSLAEREQLVTGWIEAAHRMRADGLSDRYGYIDFVMELHFELHSPAVGALIDEAIDAFEEQEVEMHEVSRVCSLLELSRQTLLPQEQEFRLRRAATRAGALLANEHSYAMSLEDIESLVDSLHAYGNDLALVIPACQGAMRSIEREIREHMRDIENVEDLDEFEDSLFQLMKFHDYSTSEVAVRIDRYREELYEEGRVSSRSGYSGRLPSGTEQDISDGDIISMFDGLKSS